MPGCRSMCSGTAPKPSTVFRTWKTTSIPMASTVRPIAIQKMAGIVQQQAMIMSFIDVFMILTALFTTLIFCALMIKKPQGAPGGGGGGH